MTSLSRIVRRTLILIALSALGAAALYSAIREHPVEVAVHRVDRGLVEASIANTRAGTVKACRRAKLAPAIGGQIARLPVRKGESVRAGDTLLEIWNGDVKADVELARKEAEASRYAAEEACVLAEQADLDARRLRTLLAKNLVSESEYDQADTKAKAARARCESARSQTATRTARLAMARAVLEKTILLAPFDGIVADINGEVGEFLTPSPTGIATLPAVDLIDTSCIYVSAPMDEVDAPAIRPGQQARITLDAFAGRSFPGVVKRVAPYVLELEKQARTVEVEALFLDPDRHGGLLPGYSADVEIILAVRDDVLRVPTEAVINGEKVLVYNEATERLEERRIETGLSNWRYTEVLSGLKVGETVVTSVGREGVAPGVLARPEAGPGEAGT